MNYHELLQKVEDQVTIFYRDHTDERLFYHNLSLTREVLGTVKRIADHYHLDDRSFFIVSAAAGFLYTGHYITGNNSPEEKSAEQASIFLQLLGVENADIDEVRSCIIATHVPEDPKSIPEKILCDADAYYLGTTAFYKKIKALKKEKDALAGTKLEGMAWRSAVISELENHIFHTDYCQLLLSKTKADNLLSIQNRHEEKIIKVAAKEQEAAMVKPVVIQTTEENDSNIIVKAKKRERPIRGSEMMFRISSSNNVRISVMADNKAHIMISVNSIIISVVLGLIIKNLNENRGLLIPTIILLLVNVVTIIYAVLATRPKMMDGRFTPEQVEKKTVNLLFFGSFYNMEYKEYDEALQALVTDREFLYNSLTKDIYWQGRVLGRKYKLLNKSYTVFMWGIIVSVLAYAIAAIFIK